MINYICGFQFLLLREFQMATGRRAGMWDPWNDGTAALSLQAAPCTCALLEHSLMFSAISSCFSCYHFYLQDATESSLSFWRIRQCSGSKGRKGWVWAAQPAHCSANCPLPRHLQQLPLHTPQGGPCRQLTKTIWVKKQHHSQLCGKSAL